MVLLEMQGEALRADMESAPTASEAAGTRSSAAGSPGTAPRPAMLYFFSGLYRSTFSEKCFVKNCTNGPSPNAQISVPNPINPPSR